MCANKELNSVYTKETLTLSNCDVCGKVFHNIYVRDFHVKNLHNMEIFYTCYVCVSNPEADESEMYHKCLYSLYIHKQGVHGENNQSLNCYIDI